MMPRVDYRELKNNCFMQQAEKGKFSLRLRIAGGKVKTKHLKRVYKIAKKYGKGYVHLTSRQSIEIPYIKLKDIEKIKKQMAERGLRQGFCGAGIRTVTACLGSLVCVSGLIDTTSLAEKIDELYYANEVPHKFKIGITGCRNNCLKAEENDLGIKGALQPSLNQENCNFCGVCSKMCPTGSINVSKEDKGRVDYDASKCILCGRCVKKCPSKSWEGKSGFIVYFGGFFGNNIQIGRQLLPTVFSTDELNAVIQKTIEFFRKYGKKGERFGTMLERVGWDKFLEKLGT